MELTILMPCLNEANTLEVCISKAQRFLAESGVVGEVVIADNGSTDGSQEIVRRCGARLIEVPIRGYGAALAEGSREARGRFVIMGDSDDSYNFLDLMPFVEGLRAGNDLVMGNRFIGGIKTGAMPWKNRWIGNPGVTAIGRLFFDAAVGDFYCGLRGYSREAFDRMDLRTLGMEFALEMVMKATFLKMRIAEVPATLRPDGRGRPPHLRPWRDGWRSLRFMLLYSPRWLFLYPGLAMAGVGVCLFVRLLFGPFRIGPVNLDVDTLHFASAMILKKALEPVLPPDVLYRKKKGFGVPIGAWFKDNRLDVAPNTLLPELNHAFVQAKFAAHRAGRADERAFLWNAWLLQSWAARPAA